MPSHVHAVILAGGAGTRFWPASRRLKPKQLLPLAGTGDEPLIAATVRRLEPLIPPERIWVATGLSLVDATARALPRVPRAHFLAEPVPRNTAPCVGWATAAIAREDPDAVVAVLPADHHIGDEPTFREAIAKAIGAAEQGWITTIGIRPTRPETGYGYIEIGDAVADGVHAAARFVEKPDAERAKALLATQRYLWNAGMFFYKASVMAGAIAKHLPALASGLAAIESAVGRPDEAEVLAEVFAKLPSISIDHGVMEKAERVAVVPGSFDWNDIGSWQSAWEMAPRDAQGNAAPEGTVVIDAKDNLVRDLTAIRSAKRWALVGVSDLVIVETDDAVLVIPRSRAQDVRAVVEALQARGEGEKT